jgi:reactive intermediate/imine deaminase
MCVGFTGGGAVEKEVVTGIPFARREDAQGRPIAPLSLAIKAGGFVFTSGMPPTDPATGKIVRGDIETQARRSLENTKIVLEAAGTSLARVVKVTVYCTNAAHFDRVNEIYRTYFPTDPPTRTFVNVGSWPHDFDIEVECMALA